MAVHFCSDEIVFRRISWTKLVNSQSCYYTKNTQQFCHITGSYKKYWACHVLNSTRPLQKGSHLQTLTRVTNLHDTFLVYFKMAKLFKKRSIIIKRRGKVSVLPWKSPSFYIFLNYKEIVNSPILKSTKVLLMYYCS